ncbi:hypothetical protein IPZ58_16850 [Streptomyces roseoverticillatus]|uniref:hypothetical protein n=1 Tax=Streptomyces roseoverticillatus TaxID=66429 RepID=UPI001F323089|nr:hypothetical protein [Streptomyces roseoverticillatus]MCF3103235.1 hypothetical protein [Streptomyces roseoverticillatus]
MTFRIPAGPHRRPWRTPAAVATAAAVVMAHLLLTAQSADSAVLPRTRPPEQHGGAAALTCAVSTLRDRPVTFTPPLSQIPRTVTVSGAMAFTDCAAHDRSVARVHSGLFTFHGSAQAICTGAQAVAGQGLVTWYDAGGHTIGSSILKPSLHHITSYNPGDALLAGTVARGKLAGARVSGSATPTSDVSGCVLGGLRTLHGRGTVAFLR